MATVVRPQAKRASLEGEPLHEPHNGTDMGNIKYILINYENIQIYKMSGGRTRTTDPLLSRPMLYQLSYCV